MFTTIFIFYFVQMFGDLRYRERWEGWYKKRLYGNKDIIDTFSVKPRQQKLIYIFFRVTDCQVSKRIKITAAKSDSFLVPNKEAQRLPLTKSINRVSKEIMW